MKRNKQESETPFWEDDFAPSMRGIKIITYGRTNRLKFSRIVSLSILWLFLIYLLFVYGSSPITWCLAAYLLLSTSISIYGIWFRKSRTSRIEEIQKSAKEITNASVIGSAVHVAGHPILDRDQPIVMALVNNDILFYSYENPLPLHRIPISEFISVKTIVYDDDRIPHADIIDSSAQALELKFLWQSNECSTLLRRMKKVRPIDWFHVIQQARLKIEK